MSFKNNLKSELKYQDIQLKELSGRINIPYGTLLSYVNHQECIANIYVGYKIAKELKVSMEYLITGNPEDNYIKQYIPIYKELLFLPPSVINSFGKIIHFLYELYKNKGV